MNLTDYHRTPLSRVFETVRHEAARHGVSILESEIVGLVPAEALSGAAPADLLLRDFSAAQTLEHRLAQTPDADFPV
jgi:glutamate formiminotransferase